jgi:hypothetical protein
MNRDFVRASMHPRVHVVRPATCRSSAVRRAAGVAPLVVAGLLAAAAVFFVAASWGAAGLQVDELRIDADARPGVVGRVTVSNPSGEAVRVTMTARRWRQGLDGKLSPDMRRGAILRTVKVNAPSFSLAPRARRTVEVSLKGTPAKRYLYAALVARGVASSKKAGLRPAYEIAIALSLKPPTARERFRLTIARPRVRKRRTGGILIDAVVRNDGNMVAPPSGTYTLRGPSARSSRIPARVAPLPGHRVRLTTILLKGLRPGRYRATADVRQRAGTRGGHASATTRFGITKGGKVTR